MNVTARDIMSKPVEAVCISDSLLTVARLFNEKNIGAAAVLNKADKPIGVITKTDLLLYQEEKEQGDAFKKVAIPRYNDGTITAPRSKIKASDVENWMTPIIFTIKPTTPLRVIARRMVRYGIHHLFVQENASAPLLGIVSSFDILRHLAAEGRP